MFEERETCYVLQNSQTNGSQMSEITREWRLGRITSSMISIPSYRSTMFNLPTREYAKKLLGLIPSEVNEAMIRGIKTESEVRDRFSQEIGKEIVEIGTAIYKKDMRFAGSLDGELIEENSGIEIKCPHNKMYRYFLEYCMYRKKYGLPRDYKSDKSFIFKSHYDQMISNAVITNKDKMYYIVLSPEDNQLYWDIIYPDMEMWNTLYHDGCQFHDKILKPLMEENNIVMKFPTLKNI